jgi:hypothetical protein
VATFRKRGPYQWQAQVREKGQPLQTKTFETRAIAEQWARAIEVEMDKGELFQPVMYGLTGPQPITATGWLNTWRQRAAGT